MTFQPFLFCPAWILWDGGHQVQHDQWTMQIIWTRTFSLSYCAFGTLRKNGTAWLCASNPQVSESSRGGLCSPDIDQQKFLHELLVVTYLTRSNTQLRLRRIQAIFANIPKHCTKVLLKWSRITENSSSCLALKSTSPTWRRRSHAFRAHTSSENACQLSKRECWRVSRLVLFIPLGAKGLRFLVLICNSQCKLYFIAPKAIN